MTCEFDYGKGKKFPSLKEAPQEGLYVLCGQN